MNPRHRWMFALACCLVASLTAATSISLLHPRPADASESGGHDSKVAYPAATVNGQPAHFELDTGSSSTSFMLKGANRLGLKILPPPAEDMSRKGEAPIGLSESVHVTLGSQSFTAPLSVINMPWYSSFISDWNPDGLVGWSEVRHNILVFDSVQRIVSSVPKLPAVTVNWLKVKVRDDSVLTIDLPMPDGKVGTILIDTGSPFGVCLPPAAWQAWRDAHPDVPLATVPYFGPDAGNAQALEGWADEISVGNLTLTDVPVSQASDVEAKQFENFAGAFGMYVLLRMDLVVDGDNHAAYLSPRPPPGPPYAGVPRPHYRANAAAAPVKNWDWSVADNVVIKSADLFVESARYKTKNEDFAGAIAACNQALDIDPENIDAYVLRGAAKDSLGDYDGAIADDNAAIAIEPKSDGAFDNRAIAEENKGDLAASIADHRHAIDLEAKNPDAWIGLGLDYQIQGNVTAAIDAYSQAVAIQPDDADYPRLYRELLQIQQGSPSPQFAKALATWPDGWTKHLGQFLAGLIDETALLAAAEKRGDETVRGQQCEANYFIGAMRVIHGDLAGARDSFQKSLATDERDYYEFKFARAALAKLTTGADQPAAINSSVQTPAPAADTAAGN
jgi:tetratricopeptide (TPR) repeat protein